jgi:hypothetical protein
MSSDAIDRRARAQRHKAIDRAGSAIDCAARGARS